MSTKSKTKTIGYLGEKRDLTEHIIHDLKFVDTKFLRPLKDIVSELVESNSSKLTPEPRLIPNHVKSQISTDLNNITELIQIRKETQNILVKITAQTK